ncbi:MAG: hypothetical protein AAGF97_06435, partial [Planctomycetota bacterium]
MHSMQTLRNGDVGHLLRLGWRLLASLALVAMLTQTASAQDSFGLDFGNQFGAEPAGKIEVNGRFITEPDGRRGVLQITVDIPAGHHIYSVTQQEGGPTATEITLDPNPGYELVGSFNANEPPHVEMVEYYSVPVESHEGQITWNAPITITEGTDVEQLVITGRLEGQLCTETNCIPFSDIAFEAPFGGRFEGLFVDEGSAGAADAASGAFDWNLLLRNVGFGILGGLILNLMPCVLPVIGLKIMSFIEQAQGSRARAFQLNVIYAAGILSVFLVLATFAAGANLS